jgi:hypothetical protein
VPPQAACSNADQLGLFLLLAGRPVIGQNVEPAPCSRFLTRLTATGSSDASEPQGYKAYSSIHLEIGVRRPLAANLAIELDLAHESREVDWMGPEKEESLGSIELLPVHLLLQYRPLLRTGYPCIEQSELHLFWKKALLEQQKTLPQRRTDPAAGRGPAVELPHRTQPGYQIHTYANRF